MNSLPVVYPTRAEKKIKKKSFFDRFFVNAALSQGTSLTLYFHYVLRVSQLVQSRCEEEALYNIDYRTASFRAWQLQVRRLSWHHKQKIPHSPFLKVVMKALTSSRDHLSASSRTCLAHCMVGHRYIPVSGHAPALLALCAWRASI
jgi:hypothetical protein